MRPASNDEKLLMLYIITCPHKNLLGLYFLPEEYICCDLRWTLEQLRKTMHELQKINRVLYDSRNSVVLIKNYLKHNPLENPNQVKAAVEKFNELPDTTCFEEFDRVIERYYKPFMKPLQKRLWERLGKPVTEEVKEEEPVAGEGEVTEVLTTPEKYFTTKVNPTPSIKVFEEINFYIDIGVEDALIIKAIDISLEKGKRNWSYMSGIIKNWANDKILTVKDLESQNKNTGPPNSNIQSKKDKLQKIRDDLRGDTS